MGGKLRVFDGREAGTGIGAGLFQETVDYVFSEHMGRETRLREIRRVCRHVIMGCVGTGENSFVRQEKSKKSAHPKGQTVFHCFSIVGLEV
jgi:hypothetical protein